MFSRQERQSPNVNESIEQVWVPFKRQTPNLLTYVRKIYERRAFMHEFSLSQRRLEHMDTFFGQLWTVMSPLFMASVYYALIFVIQGGHQGAEFFVHLISGVFFFSFISTSARRCATSITGAGRLIMNAAFPRAILPLTETWTAFLQVLPAFIVLLILQFSILHKVGWQLLFAIPALFSAFIFAAGLGMVLATANVYFRDTVSILPYITRLWMYASPVLYVPETIFKMTDHDWLASLNPIFDTLRIWSGTIAGLQTFELQTWLVSFAWGIGMFIVGSLLFLSREGEFAVRI